MKRNILFKAGFISLLIVFGFTLNALADEYPKMELRLASFFPTGSFSNKMVEWWADEIEKRSGGSITFQKFYGSALLSGMEALDGIGKGVADCGLIAPAYTASRLPLGYHNYSIPFAPRSAAQVVAIVSQLYEEFPWMHKEYAKNGVKLLYLGSASDYGIISKKPIRGLQDFKGQKIHQLGGSFAEWTTVTGMIPVSGVAIGDVYERIKLGILDGALLTPPLFVSFKTYEVAKNLIMVGLGARVALNIVFNAKKWEQLPAQVQKLFLEVGKEVEKRHAEASDSHLPQLMQIMKSKGVAFHELLSEEDRLKWAEIAPDTLAKTNRLLEGEYPEIWDMSDRYIQLSEQYGHKWLRKFGKK